MTFARIHRVAFAVALFLVTDCATTSAPAPRAPTQGQASTAPTAAPTKPRVICEKEAMTGSHISSRRCHVADDAERERIATQRQLSQPRATEPPPGS